MQVSVLELKLETMGVILGNCQVHFPLFQFKHVHRAAISLIVKNLIHHFLLTKLRFSFYILVYLNVKFTFTLFSLTALVCFIYRPYQLQGLLYPQNLARPFPGEPNPTQMVVHNMTSTILRKNNWRRLGRGLQTLRPESMTLLSKQQW